MDITTPNSKSVDLLLSTLAAHSFDVPASVPSRQATARRLSWRGAVARLQRTFFSSLS